MPPEHLIQIRDLSRRDAKSGRLLLDRIDFDLFAGDRIGLVGPTGSGKSSLLRAIARLDPCQAGQVLYRGQTVSRDAVPCYRRRVIYLPQRPAFVAGSVLDNLQLPQRFRAANSDVGSQADSQRGMIREQSLNWLGDFARSERLLDQSVQELSGGEQQIVALIRAMLLRPCVLLLDEPTAALDAAATEQFEQLVLSWHSDTAESPAATRGLVWTSHDVAQLRRVTNRIARMSEGTLTMENHS